MKKQIAILATVLAASAFTAYSQDWIDFSTPGKTTWNDTAGLGSSGNYYATGGDLSAILLWAPTGTQDSLASVGTSFGLKAGPANDQVATNATSVASANPESSIATMLANGWAIAGDLNSGAGTAATNTMSVGGNTASAAGSFQFNAGSTFELNGGTGVSGSSIELIVLGYNASAASYLTASDLGWSNPFSYVVGSSDTDPNVVPQGGAAGGMNAFGVAAVPEPATLALAGLGGLSMLFLRRRKA